jgi:hypothetical protein
MTKGAGRWANFRFQWSAFPARNAAGQYRKTTLLDRYGADMSMPDLRHELAQCPRRNNWSDPWMVVYRDRVER